MGKVDVITIVSGGLDSTTLMYKIKEQGKTQRALSFDYGQRHSKELSYAMHNCMKLGIEWSRINLTSITSLLSSALTSPDVPVPEGHYAAENMRSTVVPNRNAIMLSIAFGVAASCEAEKVAIGVHAGDHPIYPDCRPAFLDAFWNMEAFSLDNLQDIPAVYAPFITDTKEGIVREGARLGVRFQDTWSCYNGDTVHCGVCGTCVERYEAFRNAGIADPTVYRSDPRVHLQHQEG
jgi:7-cyano-7-deazaguanine synthase